jgi:hypothetical protein
MVIFNPFNGELYRLFTNTEVQKRIRNEIGKTTKDSFVRVLQIAGLSVLEGGKLKAVKIDELPCQFVDTLLDFIFKAFRADPKKIANAKGHADAREWARLQQSKESGGTTVSETDWYAADGRPLRAWERKKNKGSLESSPVALFLGLWGPVNALPVLLEIITSNDRKIQLFDYTLFLDLLLIELRERSEELRIATLDRELPHHPPPIYFRPQIRPNSPNIAA